MQNKIKVLISGGKSESGLTQSYARAFAKAGHHIIVFNDDEHIRVTEIPVIRKIVFRLFWRFLSRAVQDDFNGVIKAEKPDFVLIIKGWFYSPEALSRMKDSNKSSFFFCFNPDNPFNTWHSGSSNRWIRKAITSYDCYFIWGKFLMDKLFKSEAKRVEYLPFAFDPALHFPVIISQEDQYKYNSEIVFIGSWDEEREYWLNHISDYPIVIWGNAWDKANKRLRSKWMGRTIVGEEFSKACACSKIVLNLIRKQNAPAHNMRTFEVPACGGFMLTTRTEEQRDFFKEGEEIDCFSTPDEMKEKVHYYLVRDELRKKMAEKAFQKVQSYTYLERTKKILETYTIMRGNG